MSSSFTLFTLALAASVQAGFDFPTVAIPSVSIPSIPSPDSQAGQSGADPTGAGAASPNSPLSGVSGSTGIPTSAFGGGAQGTASSPAYQWMFDFAMPVPPVAQPKFTQTSNGIPVQFYESTIEAFQMQIYPDLGPANLVGYNGSFPGPTFMIPRGTETVVRYLNNGSENATVHLHGSYTHSVWDGWASDDVPVGTYKDYYYPNSESARAMWYHDHVHGQTAKHAYYGQAGIYIIYDPAEDALGLPSGAYDVPIAITDRTYTSDGDLASPEGSPMNFFGDTIEVNGQPWPYLAVEPRKYRFRLFDMSLSRPYDLYFADDDNNTIPFLIIGSDSGLFASPVSSSDVVISTGERYEVVFDFSDYAGQNVTLMNDFQGSGVQNFANTDKVMRFVVGTTVTDDSNNGDVPSSLSDIPWPTQKTDVDHTFNFQLGGEDTWTINGVTFNDVNNRVLARPPQGTVELWELHHSGGPAVHPVHVHLVNMQVISRTGGSRGLLPYEAAGLKDTVLLEPGETVQVLAVYGPWNGMYMFHCHNLIHEDQMMLDVFNVTKLEELGYEFGGTQVFGQPMDAQFAPVPYTPQDFDVAAEAAVVSSLAALNAYAPASALMAAEAAYYQTATVQSASGLPQVTARAVASWPTPSIETLPTPALPAPEVILRRVLNGPSEPTPTAIYWRA